MGGLIQGKVDSPVQEETSLKLVEEVFICDEGKGGLSSDGSLIVREAGLITGQEEILFSRREGTITRADGGVIGRGGDPPVGVLRGRDLHVGRLGFDTGRDDSIQEQEVLSAGEDITGGTRVFLEERKT